MSATLTPRKVAGFGWIRDLPDHRDLRVVRDQASTFPRTLSLRSEMPPVFDQAQLGSCTGNGIAGVLEHQAMRQGHDHGTPARLWIYYQERVIEGTVSQDAGAQIRDGVKVVAHLGCPPETDWPYSDQNPGPFQGPVPQAASRPAEDNIYRGLHYYRCPQDLWDMKWCIVNHYPLVFGCSVFQGFESPEVAQTGVVALPSASDQPIGGHCMVIVGYDDARQVFEVRNSWSESWGDAGHCWMPYAYLLDQNLSSDVWSIRLVVGVTR